MDDETAAIETCQLAGLWVPTSLVDLVENWANRTRESATDVLRSILNMGLAHYVQMYPQSVPQMAKAMGDLDRMAPEGARRYRLDAVERADGQLTLRCAEPSEPDTVKIEVAAQPKLAGLLKAHAALCNRTVGDMLLELWLIEMVQQYTIKGDRAMVAAILEAWEEQGIPEYVAETVTKIMQVPDRASLEPVE